MTSEEQRGLARLMLRMPEWRDGLRSTVLRDAVLQEICGEYDAAWTALGRFAQLTIPSEVVFWQEYRYLIGDLEDEFLGVLAGRGA